MSDSNKNADKLVLSEREAELLVCYFRTAEGDLPKADWDKFAEMAGYKNAGSASVSFGSLKRKILGTGDGGSAKPTPKKPTPSKRKQAQATTFEPAYGDGDESEESPTKKMKPTPKKDLKKKDVKAESDDVNLSFV